MGPGCCQPPLPPQEARQHAWRAVRTQAAPKKSPTTDTAVRPCSLAAVPAHCSRQQIHGWAASKPRTGWVRPPLTAPSPSSLPPRSRPKTPCPAQRSHRHLQTRHQSSPPNCRPTVVQPQHSACATGRMALLALANGHLPSWCNLLGSPGRQAPALQHRPQKRSWMQNLVPSSPTHRPPNTMVSTCRLHAHPEHSHGQMPTSANFSKSSQSPTSSGCQ
mmetsp:Transcript_37075/g.73398  ORF Transcript_37075/g.73398 Transcript_37075/m.73398 type:complete len:218 (-) Transcript_37075:2731-3384(-)